jgi:hypothetical protein
MKPALAITPETRVGALLEAYPELEPVLLEMSPEFHKLKNPILRRTVARLATLAQAARLARLDARELVLKLRERVGHSVQVELAPDGASSPSAEVPDWVDPRRIRVTLDAQTLLEAGESPLAAVSREAQRLGPGDLLRLTSGFFPEPLVEALTKQGFRVFSRPTEKGAQETFVTPPLRG